MSRDDQTPKKQHSRSWLLASVTQRLGAVAPLLIVIWVLTAWALA